MGCDNACGPVSSNERDSFCAVMSAAAAVLIGVVKEEEKQLAKLVRRMKAKIRKRMSNKETKIRKGCGFRYDPLSYSLNFDSGSSGFFCL